MLQNRIMSGFQSRISGGSSGFLVRGDSGFNSGSYLIDERSDSDFAPIMLQSAAAMMPMSMSRTVTPAAIPVHIEVRKTFPETWLFESFDFDSR